MFSMTNKVHDMNVIESEHFFKNGVVLHELYSLCAADLFILSRFLKKCLLIFVNFFSDNTVEQNIFEINTVVTELKPFYAAKK